MRTRIYAISAEGIMAVLCTSVLFLFAGDTLAAQPTNLNAFHRSGQTFLTWTEDSTASGEGYHIYRHTAVITAANLGQTRCVTTTWGPMSEGSSIFYTERDREAQSGDYPGLENYVITDLGPELDDTTGLFVWTTEQSGDFYYAVTTVSGTVENTSDFGSNNSLQVPVEESVFDPSPVLVWQGTSGTSRVYTQFMNFESYNPTFDRPTQGLSYAYNYLVSLPTPEMCDGSVPNVLPLYLQIEGFGSRYEVHTASPWGWCAVGVWGDDPRQSWYYGFSATHDFRSGGTTTTGPIVNYTEQRVLRSLYDTMRSPLYNIDGQRIYVYGHSMGGSGALAFGMRYPSVFAATYSSEPMTNYSTSGDGGGIDWRDDTVPKWGSLADNLPIENRGRYAGPLTQYDGTGVWDWQNHQAQLVSRRGDEMAYIGLAHGARDDVIEWTTQGVPAYEPFYLGRRVFSGETLDLDHSWAAFAGQGPMAEDWSYNGAFHSLSVLRDETMPALSYGSGSSEVPPTGAGASYNMNLEWSASWHSWDGNPVDLPEQWQVSLRTTDGSTQTVDVTPRRTQSFVITPGATYTWQNRSVDDNNGIASGTVIADSDGLLTVSSFQVTPGGNRLVIGDSGGGQENQPPSAAFVYSISNLTVSFVDRSSDSDGTLVSWMWTFGDGAQSSEQEPMHTYSADGSYQIQLLVTDDDGATNSTTQPVTVSAGGGGGGGGVAATEYRREWPLSRRGVSVFNDQLAPRMSETQVSFCASNYAGTQKMTRSEADRLRAVNPDFLILHYRLGHGLGFRGIQGDCEPTGTHIPIIEGDEWTQEWPGDNVVEENWFYHWPEPSGVRVLNCDWGWYLMELDDAGWRNYWYTEVLRQVEANDNDGVFMDSLSVPNYLGADHYDPAFPWIDEAFEIAWATRIENWLQWLQEQDLGAYYLIPNVGQWITSREQTNYAPADGLMVEGFALEGSGEPYAIGDWQLQMNRILEMVVANKVMQLMSYSVWEEQTRMFILGSYLLAKGDRTYLNLEIDYDPEWWPEYDVPIGAPTESAGSDINNLWDGADQIYRRSFDNGIVLVNPDPTTSVTVNLGETMYQVTASGGGSLPGNAVPTGSLAYNSVSQVNLEPASAAILLDAEPECANAPSPPTGLQGEPWDGGHTLAWSGGSDGPPDHYNIYRSSGGCPDEGIVPVLFAEAGGIGALFIDIPSQNCTTFYYTISASDAGNFCESDYSNCFSVIDTTGCQQSSWRRPSGRAGSRP